MERQQEGAPAPTSPPTVAKVAAVQASGGRASGETVTETPAADVSSIEVFRGGSAVGESDVIQQVREMCVRDLRFSEAAHEQLNGASTAHAPLPPALTELAEDALAAEGHALGHAKRDALTSLLVLRARDIEAHQHEACVRASRQLVLTYQQQVARLQAALVRQLGELGAAAQRNVEAETKRFMQLGLPAIHTLLSDPATPADDADSALTSALASAAAPLAMADSEAATASKSGAHLAARAATAAAEAVAPVGASAADAAQLD